jgi:uncharacterized repeat protein (TIGR03803 family)
LLGSLFTARAQGPILYGVTVFGPDTSSNPNNSYVTGTIFRYSGYVTSTTVHSFNGLDGSYVWNSLIKASNGLMYGTSRLGGTDSLGTIFSFDYTTDSVKLLHSCKGGSDLSSPSNSLIQATNGKLYGLSQSGGMYNQGTLYSYDISARVISVLYSFGSSTDVTAPTCKLIQASDGNLYGVGVMNMTGGYNGAILKFDISSGQESIAYIFTGGTDGSYPNGNLIQATNGLLYGVTEFGGADSLGTIYSYDIATSTKTVAYSFHGPFDIKNPKNSLFQASNGWLYSLDYQLGRVFCFDIASAEDSILQNTFSGSGQYTYGELMQASDGNLYGTSSSGGLGGNGNPGPGFVYRIVLTAPSYYLGYAHSVYQFGFDHNINVDGSWPLCQLVEVAHPASVQEVPATLTCDIFPNPTPGIITVQLPGHTQNALLEIYNILGNKVCQTLINDSQTSINLSNEAAGTYLLKIRTSDHVQTSKVVLIK